MDHVGVVGAGVAGCAAAYALADADRAIDVTVLEATDRVGGRAASRTRGEYVYDHGANYVKSDDERVASLLTEALDSTGLVDVTEPIYTFDASGSVSPGRDTDDHKWTYESGLRTLSHRLLDPTDATIHFETPVVRPERRDDGWLAHARSGAEYGPFDALVLTPPAPATGRLLAEADWDADRREALAAALGAVDYRTIFSAVLGYDFPLDRPYYGLVNTDKAHDVGWLSREECKRGHVPDGETVLVVQASHDWSVAHAGDDSATNAEVLAEKAATIVGEERLERPDWTDARLWDVALPDGGLDPSLVDGAREHDCCLAGDAVAGEGRIHAALASGLRVGNRLAER